MREFIKWIAISALGIAAAALIVRHAGMVESKQQLQQSVVTGKVIQRKPTQQERISECLNDKMCKYLSEALYYESRSEPVEGMVAVAFVILNRINHPSRWGSTVREVLSEKNQFTYRWDGSMRAGFKESKAYNRVVVVSHKILNGEKSNPIGKADHYKTVDAKPKWNYNKLTKVAVIGRHEFYQHK